MDKIDKAILAILQEDATASLNEIAAKVNLSAAPCWRRIQKLEEEKIILRRVALLNAKKLNVGVNVFVQIKTNQHNDVWFEKFRVYVSQIPEIVEFYRMSGDVDYLLRIVVPDIGGYDAIYQKLVAEIEFLNVSASFAMEQIKFTTTLPLDYEKL
jgi:Lrp/AsnC family transcriptional regulator